MPRRPNSALRAVVGATACVLVAACAQLPFGQSAPDPEPELPPAPPAPVWEAPPAEAASASDPETVDRLVRLADVWHAVRAFHPAVAARGGAWDTVYLRTVAEARAAADDEAFAQVVEAMLGALGDPETRVVRESAAGVRVPPGVPAASVRTLGDSLLMARPLRFAARRELEVQQLRLPSMLMDTMPARVAVLDLRADSGGSGDQAWSTRDVRSDELPFTGEVTAGLARRRLRRDRPPARDAARERCCLRWTLTTDIVRPAAAARGADAADGRDAADAPGMLAVIVDDATLLPGALLSLHAAGRATIVSTGTGVLRTGAAASLLPLGGGAFARVRTEELRTADGAPLAARADTVIVSAGGADPLVPDSTDAAVQLAITIARGEMRVQAALARPSRASVAPAAPAEEAAYPSLPERLLGVSRLWASVRAFDPYVPMADESWDEMFRRAITEVETAASARTYAAALFRFTAALDASQVELHVPDHPEFGRQRGWVPFHVRLVDRRPLVVAIDDSAAARSGVRVGDEIIAIGGEPVDRRLGRWRELMSASNGWSRDERLQPWLESGPALVKATYRVRGTSPEQRDVEFSYAAPSADGDDRSPEGALLRPGASTRRAVREVSMLGGNVALVRAEQVDASDATVPVATSLPTSVSDAAGVIVDLRGVAGDAALRWLAGSPLDADERPYARDARSELIAPPAGSLRSPELDPSRQLTLTERVTPRVAGERFGGPIAVLLDATTIGEGELLALRLAAGGGRRVLVGSPTAGAVGETTEIMLAGAVRVRFPVSDVRRIDGRFIQRLGVAPDVLVSPTVEGVRNGRDEVLEAAQKWIAQQLAPPPARRR